MTTAAKDLAKAIRTKSFLHLPDKHLRSKVEDLCSIFQETLDNIITAKLSPLQQESAPPKLIKTPTKKTATQPRVNLKPTEEALLISHPIAEDNIPKSLTMSLTQTPKALPPTHIDQQN